MADAAAIGEILEGALLVGRLPIGAQPSRRGQEIGGECGTLVGRSIGIRIEAVFAPKFVNLCGYIVHVGQFNR